MLGLVAGTTLLAGCSFAPAAQQPEAIDAMPERFAQAETLATYAPLAWWSRFDDPVLDRLVDSTLVSNLDLAEAVARVEAAAAQARVSRAALFPSLNGTVSGSYQNQSLENLAAQFGGAGPPGAPPGEGPPDDGGEDEPDRIEIEQYSAAVGLSYELDFWGRVRNSTKAAYADAAAAASDLRTAQLGVISTLVSTYFEVVDLRERIRLTLSTVDLLAERVELTEDRYERGLVTSFELYRILQDYRTTQAGLPQLEADLTDAEGRLAVLVGRYAGQIDDLLPDALDPQLPLTAVPVDQPSEILFQRPDVRSALLRYEAARYRIGAARASLLPSLSLSGQLGTQGISPGDVLDVGNWFSSLTGNLTAPLFQGGRLRANLSASEAAYAQQGAAYARTVLTAYQEAESALERHEEERQRFEFLQSQLDEATAQADLQTRRYRQGVGDYTAFLDAQRNELLVRTSLSAAGRSVALARLGVHRALGGDWTDQPPFN